MPTEREAEAREGMAREISQEVLGTPAISVGQASKRLGATALGAQQVWTGR